MTSTNSVLFLHSFNLPWIALNFWSDDVHMRSYVNWQMFLPHSYILRMMLRTLPDYPSYFLDVYEIFSVPLLTLLLESFPFSSTSMAHVSIWMTLFLLALVHQSNYRLNFLLTCFFSIISDWTLPVRNVICCLLLIHLEICLTIKLWFLVGLFLTYFLVYPW